MNRLSLFIFIPWVILLGSLTPTMNAYAESQQYVAVLPLINKSPKEVSTEETLYLTSVIRKMTGFLPSQSYIIITNDNIDILLQAKDKNLEECVGTCALDTARNLGAHWLITGKVLKFGSSLRVELNLIRSEDGNVFTAPETIKGKDVEMLENPIKLASLGLMLKISQRFKIDLTAKAGVNRQEQLTCLLNQGECKGSGNTRSLDVRSAVTRNDDAEYEAEMARLEKEERLKQVHEEKIDKEWAKVEKLSRKKAKRGLKLIRVFLKKYRNHPLGNPREFDAQGLLTELEEEVRANADRKKVAQHEKKVTRDWKRAKRTVSKGTDAGKKVLDLFLKKYENHELGNPFAEEAQKVFNKAHERVLESQRVGHERKVRSEWSRLKKSIDRMNTKNKSMVKRGIAELKKLKSKYTGHTLGNPVEEEIRKTIDHLESLLNVQKPLDLNRLDFQKINGSLTQSFNIRKRIQRRATAKLERLSKAVEKKLTRMIKRTSDDNPKKPEYLNRLAMFYWQQAGEQVTKAYHTEEKCIASSQNEDDIARCTQQRKHVVLQTESTRDKAIQVYTFLVERYPNYARLDEVLFALGFNFQQKEKWQDAKTIYTSIITQFPQSDRIPDVLFNLGEIHFALRNMDEASQLYNHIITHYPKSSIYPYAAYQLGQCYSEQFKFQASFKQFVKVIEFEKKMAKDKKKSILITLGKAAQMDLVRILVKQNKAPQASLQSIRRHVQERYYPLGEYLANLYHHHGRREEAKKTLRALISGLPNTKKTGLYLMRIKERLDEFETE